MNGFITTPAPPTGRVQDGRGRGTADSVRGVETVPALRRTRPEATATGLLARTLTARLGRRLGWGSILVEDDFGRLRLGEGEPRANVRVHNLAAYVALIRQGSVGLGHGYVEGLWDSDDLTSLVRVLVHNRGSLGQLRDRLGGLASRLTDPVQRRRRRSPAQDLRDVQTHYDIGNAFFALMLDPTLTYSCAIFDGPDVPLEDASIAKLDRICKKLDLSSTDHVLEIGTGWGSFAMHAATKYGCRVTTTTISTKQYEYATERVAQAGLTDLVSVLREDYRDLEGRYDKLVSIEMVEAVDWRSLGTYFSKCASLVKPDGLMALQAITIADQSYERAKNGRDFIKTFVFPGSCLPSVESLARAAAHTDLRIVDLEDIGRHYAETLARWRDNVDTHRTEIAGLGYDERFVRLWLLYLAYCEAAFLERHISDVQVVLARTDWRPPLLPR